MRITQALRRAVQTQAHTRATLCGDREQNWETLEARVARLAAGLRALGVTEGDRVGILALNSDRYLEVIYAVAWAGAVANPVNIRLLAYVLFHSCYFYVPVFSNFYNRCNLISPITLRKVDKIIINSHIFGLLAS